MVLHCLFLHFAVPSTADERYWNIAADIVVEKMIDSHGEKCETLRFSVQKKSLSDNRRE